MAKKAKAESVDKSSDKSKSDVETASRQEQKFPTHEGGPWKPGFAPNPKGVGGFGDNPQNRSNGKWKKENSISYQYNRLLAMTDEEYKEFKPKTNAEKIANRRIQRALRDDDSSLGETKEITDRTEGRPKQDIGLEVDETSAPLIRGFVIPTMPSDYIDEQIAKARAKKD